MCSSPKAPVQNTVAPPPPAEAPKPLAIPNDKRAANNMSQLRIKAPAKSTATPSGLAIPKTG